jgi:hypothetical protein
MVMLALPRCILPAETKVMSAEIASGDFGQ